jgi:hypothetical protein
MFRTSVESKRTKTERKDRCEDPRVKDVCPKHTSKVLSGLCHFWNLARVKFAYFHEKVGVVRTQTPHVGVNDILFVDPTSRLSEPCPKERIDRCQYPGMKIFLRITPQIQVRALPFLEPSCL